MKSSRSLIKAPQPVHNYIKSSPNIGIFEILDNPNKGLERVNKPVFHDLSLKNHSSQKQDLLTVLENSEEAKIEGNNLEKELKIDAIETQEISQKNTSRLLKVNFPNDLEEAVSAKRTKKSQEVNIQEILPFIIKLQARVKGAQAREKFKLMRAKPVVSYRGCKLINKKQYMIVILKHAEKCFLFASDENVTHKLEIPINMNPKEAIKYLSFDLKKGLHIDISVTDTELSRILLRTRLMKLDGDECEVKYFTDPIINDLHIRLQKLSNNRIYTYDKKNIGLNSQPILIQYINEIVQPNLAIIDQHLTVRIPDNLQDKKMIAIGSRIFEDEIYKITAKSINSRYVEFSIENSNNETQTFKIDYEECNRAINVLGTLETDPNLLLLCIRFSENKLHFDNVQSNVRLILTTKMRVSGLTEYNVNVFYIKESKSSNYFITANKSSGLIIESLSILEKDLSRLLKVNVDELINSADLIGDQLIFTQDNKLSILEILQRQSAVTSIKIIKSEGPAVSIDQAEKENRDEKFDNPKLKFILNKSGEFPYS